MKFEQNSKVNEENPEIFTSFDLSKIRGSYYDLLGVVPTSTSLQVREAYFRLKATYTDSNQAIYSLMTGSDLADKIKAIEEAFDVLRDVDSRSRYNENIGITERAGASRTDILIENISFPPTDEAMRKALLAELRRSDWNLTSTATALGMTSAANVLRAIRRLGLVTEYDAAKADGKIYLGGRRDSE